VKLAEVRREIGLELATSMERIVSTVGIGDYRRVQR
jgi:hypothetical protein